MTDDFDPEFKQLLRKLITDRLAKEVAAGRSWREARQKMQDIFDIDEELLASQAARMLELDRESIEAEFDPDLADPAVIDLAAAREQRKDDKTKKSEDKRKKIGAYGIGVRNQVFEVVVRQGLAGAAWRSICAGPLAVNNIDPDDVQKEIDRRKRSMLTPGHRTTGDGKKDDDAQACVSGADAKASSPKKTFPFFGGAGLALGLPHKNKDNNSPGKKTGGKNTKIKNDENRHNKDKSDE